MSLEVGGKLTVTSSSRNRNNEEHCRLFKAHEELLRTIKETEELRKIELLRLNTRIEGLQTSLISALHSGFVIFV